MAVACRQCGMRVCVRALLTHRYIRLCICGGIHCYDVNIVETMRDSEQFAHLKVTYVPTFCFSSCITARQRKCTNDIRAEIDRV